MAAIRDVSPISIMPHYVPLSADAAAAAAAAQRTTAAARGRMYGRSVAQAQVTYQQKMAKCRTDCAPRPVLWQNHCRNLCMQGKVMPCIANEPWPPCVAARSVKGVGELPAPLGVPLWGWAAGAAGIAALIYFTRR